MIIDCFREGGAESAVISLCGNVQTLGTKPDGAMCYLSMLFMRRIVSKKQIWVSSVSRAEKIKFLQK